MTRITAGVYVSACGRHRVERVNAEARRAGYGDGWHLFTDDNYVDTFATKREATERALGRTA